jgi:methylisocitrate lyase
VFRSFLKNEEIIVIPGVYDVLTALLAKKAGHQAILAGGYAVVSSLLGLPDMGIITLNEMVDTVRRIFNVIDIPIIADIDTGYGGILNVIRTVKEIESAGACGIQIEDQIFPKRAGLTAGRQVISMEKMVDKLHAAVDTKKDGDFVVIARTDAQPLDEAIKRSNAYYEAGADVLFIEDIHSEDAMVKINKEVYGPTLAVMVEGSGYPFLPAKRLEELGFKLVYYCNSALFTATKAVYEVMKALKEKGSSESLINSMILFDSFNELIGFNRFTNQQEKYK